MSKHWFYPFFRPYDAPKGKRVYVSGPMTGIGDNNGPAFDAAAEALRAMGYAVCNPNETDGILGELSFETYLRFDTERVLEADFLVALPQWERSRGATFEILTAIRIGTAVWGWENWKEYDRITEARVLAAVSDLYSGRTVTVSHEVREAARKKAEAEAVDAGGTDNTQPATWEVGTNETVPVRPSVTSQVWYGDDRLVWTTPGRVELLLDGEPVVFFENVG